ncbi:MAG: sugar ABC transporter permease [Clostridia bacterium]|nr:sugar ABC transporter permease [Clostridia bacterium]
MATQTVHAAAKGSKLSSAGKILASDMKRNYSLYLLMIPVLLFYFIFMYRPMYGAIIAFKDFNPADGIWNSPNVGLDNFRKFWDSMYRNRIFFNTLKISFSTLIFGFPAPIILALLINELRSKIFTKSVQTITYLPHFISLVVVCGMIKDFTTETGIINDIIKVFGGTPTTMLNNPRYFVPIYVISDIWQGIGWGSIIYLAALSGIDAELYEAARIDGAGRWRQTLSITIPSIIPTIITMLLLRVGQMMNIGYEKIILLYNPLTYETADVISSFVYREGLQNFQYSYSTAVGLLNSVINFILVFGANMMSKKFNDTSLW